MKTFFGSFHYDGMNMTWTILKSHSQSYIYLYIFLYLTESTMCFSQPTSCYSDSLEVLMLLQSVFPSGRRQGPNKVLHIQKGSLEHPFRCLFFSLSDFFICICQCFCASHRKKSQLLTLTGLWELWLIHSKVYMSPGWRIKQKLAWVASQRSPTCGSRHSYFSSHFQW